MGRKWASCLNCQKVSVFVLSEKADCLTFEDPLQSHATFARPQDVEMGQVTEVETKSGLWCQCMLHVLIYTSLIPLHCVIAVARIVRT